MFLTYRLGTCCIGLKALQGTDNAFEDAAALLQRDPILHNSHNILLGAEKEVVIIHMMKQN